MVINEKELLIIQYNESQGIWEDCTKRVQWYDMQDNACRIKYVGNNTFYWKSYRDIQFFDKHGNPTSEAKHTEPFSAILYDTDGNIIKPEEMDILRMESNF